MKNLLDLLKSLLSMGKLDKYIDTIKRYNPYHIIDDNEVDMAIQEMVSLLWTVKGKKITKISFFIEILSNDRLMEYFKNIMGADEMEVYREILRRYPSICNSQIVIRAIGNGYGS